MMCEVFPGVSQARSYRRKLITRDVFSLQKCNLYRGHREYTVFTLDVLKWKDLTVARQTGAADRPSKVLEFLQRDLHDVSIAATVGMLVQGADDKSVCSQTFLLLNRWKMCLYSAARWRELHVDLLSWRFPEFLYDRGQPVTVSTLIQACLSIDALLTLEHFKTSGKLQYPEHLIGKRYLI